MKPTPAGREDLAQGIMDLVGFYASDLDSEALYRAVLALLPAPPPPAEAQQEAEADQKDADVIQRVWHETSRALAAFPAEPPDEISVGLAVFDVHVLLHLAESAARVRALRAHPAELAALRAFWKAIYPDDLFETEGFQEKAVEAGLLREEEYDPAIHGENDYDMEPGDPIYVPVKWPTTAPLAPDGGLLALIEKWTEPEVVTTDEQAGAVRARHACAADLRAAAREQGGKA